MTFNFSTKANADQREAIVQTDGPLLIIAGPGSGKTFTLVERVVYLITEKSARPESILIATFTEKAASELITRITNRLLELGIKANINDMYVGTFHSICLKIIDEYREFTRLKRNYSLMDQFDQQYFLYQNSSAFDEIENIDEVLGEREKTSKWMRAEALLGWVNKISEEAIDVSQLAASNNSPLIALSKLAEKYQALLIENNLLDFSSIQSETLALLENNPNVLSDLKSRFSHLMVDEYQDTNTIQELILFSLAGDKENICVVGDDDQGLYRFRGATIRNILEFPNRFSGRCNVVQLSKNYRSHPDIINLYNTWMDQVNWTSDSTSFRYEKKIIPFEENASAFPSVCKVSGTDGDENWHQEVLFFLRFLQSEEIITDWNQIALLFRSVRSDRVTALADFLEAEGIPVYSPRSNMFFDRPEIRLIIGAIIFLFPQFRDVRQWRDGAHLPIWDYYDGCFRDFAEELRKGDNRDLLAWAKIRAKEHLALVEATDYGFSGLFYQLLQFPLFSRYLKIDLNEGVRDTRPARNLAIFSNMLVKFEYLHHIKVISPEYVDKSIRDLFNSYLRFLIDGGIDEYEDVSEYAPTGCLSFMTIHQSKGLEFPVVMVGSLEAVPRKQYTELDALLQAEFYRKKPFEPIERTKEFDFWRLFYTAFSRAQNLLVLTCQENVAGGRGQRNVPSSYFRSIYDGLPDWKAKQNDLRGLKVEHVKDVNLKKEYSFTSHITLFENCSQQYRFFRELAFAPVRKNAMLFGILVHQTIEDIHKAALTGRESQINEPQIGHWFEMNYANLCKKERVYLAPRTKEYALEHILRYVRREGKNWAKLKEAEVDISLVKEDYILSGTVDLIRGEDGTVEIIDFKSEKKPDLNNERGRLEQYRRQLEVYAHLVEEKTGNKVSKMHLYYTGEDAGNPYVSFPYNTKSVAQTVGSFDAVVKRIEQHDYALMERPYKQCKECDMRFYCDYNL